MASLSPVYQKLSSAPAPEAVVELDNMARDASVSVSVSESSSAQPVARKASCCESSSDCASDAQVDKRRLFGAHFLHFT